MNVLQLINIFLYINFVKQATIKEYSFMVCENDYEPWFVITK